MKRTLLIAGMALAVIGIGAVPAFAGADGQPSDECSNGNWTETTVTPSPVNVATEHTPVPWNGGLGVTLCYSDTPQNGAPSNVAGGYVNVGFNDGGNVWAKCRPDPGTDVTVDCNVFGHAGTTDDSSRIGRTASATVTAFDSGVTIGQTGVEVANPTPTVNAPQNGDNYTGGSVAFGAGTCAYANSGTGVCPLGGTSAGATVNEADVVPVVATPAGGGCTGVNNTCVVPDSTVTVGSDTVNPTVAVTTPLGTTTTANVPKQCVGIGTSC